MTITRLGGTAVCPFGQLTGSSDADSLRSTMYSDGNKQFVHNVFTGISLPVPAACTRLYSAPAVVREIVAALINQQLPEGTTLGAASEIADNLFRVTSFSNQLDGRNASDYGPALAAHDVDASALDVNRVLLASGQYAFETIAINYGNLDAEQAADQPTGSEQDEVQLVDELESRHAPASVLAAVKKLVIAGFECTKPDGATLLFRKGDKYSAIRAQVSWIPS